MPLEVGYGNTGIYAVQDKVFNVGSASGGIGPNGFGIWDGWRYACPAVRERMVALQRAMGQAGGVVMDGRDIGTVVFPNAPLKFFLDADLTVRADRRLKDLQRVGATAEPSAIREEVARRDARDRARAVAPLRPAPDAIRIDSTWLEAEAVVGVMLGEVAKVLNQDKS